MPYELAAKLRDAGFPQNSDNPKVYLGSSIENRAVVPTLEELIEACGEGLRVLYNTSVQGTSYWWAYNTKDWENDDNSLSGQGNTAARAVANLWLALNKHE